MPEVNAIHDAGTIERALRLRGVMNEYLQNVTPQERDRLMQIQLAQARGPVLNAKLLFDMTAMLLRARRLNQPRERRDVGQSDL